MLASVTVSDPLVAAALWTGTAAFAISVAMLAGVLVLRVRLIRRLEHEREFAGRWRPMLAACSEKVPERLPPLHRRDGAQFLRLWIHAQESVAGDARRHLIELARRVGADRHAVEMLTADDRRTELLALTVLGHMGLPSTAALAESLLEDRSAVFSVTAAQAFLRIEPARALPIVLRVAARRADWPIAKVAAMLAESGADAAGAALSAAIVAASGVAESRPSRAPELVRLLRLLHVARMEDVRPALLRILERTRDAETLAAALAALAHPEDAHWARSAAGHSQWYVRVQAAKALARLGTAGDRDLLLGLLPDPNWWVRYRAAQALARLPGMTPAELRALRAAAADPYASAMLGQVLSELEAA